MADRAYLDFRFFDDLSVRGVFFVVRKKSNMLFDVVKRPQSAPKQNNVPTNRRKVT